MVEEPATKRVVAFVDGQNLFRCAKEIWNYTHPNYDVTKLANAVAGSRAFSGWNAPSVRFYTGVPEQAHDAFWASFWQRKIAAMRAAGAYVFSRSLRYRRQHFVCKKCGEEQNVTCRNCGTECEPRGNEKGIDVRIALDVVGMALANEYDVALIFSQDQDLSEAADEVRTVAKQQRRWIKVASARGNEPTRDREDGLASV
jgi:hypothetical protein